MARFKKAQGDVKENILLALVTSFPKLNEHLLKLEGKEFIDAFYKLARLVLPTETSTKLDFADSEKDTRTEAEKLEEGKKAAELLLKYAK